jgi:hypothetical protein
MGGWYWVSCGITPNCTARVPFKGAPSAATRLDLRAGLNYQRFVVAKLRPADNLEPTQEDSFSVMPSCCSINNLKMNFA